MRRWLGGLALLLLAAGVAGHALRERIAMGLYERGAARAILTGSPEQVFVAAREGDHVIGVGRLGRSGDWGGIAAMWVDPAYRRRGVASGLVAAAAHSAQDRGVGRLHLQVWARNAAARALYRRAGFVAHHAYVNLRSGSCR